MDATLLLSAFVAIVGTALLWGPGKCPTIGACLLTGATAAFLLQVGGSVTFAAHG